LVGHKIFVMAAPDAHIFGLSVAAWPKWLVLMVGAGGIFTSFILDGIAHEHLIKHYHFHGTFFLTFIQFVGYSALSLPTAQRILTRRVSLTAPLWAYLATGLCLAFSMSLTNFAAVRLSYATGVLFKSSKLIPVLIGNVIFLHKKPKLSEAFSVLLIVFGLIGISLGDFRGRNKFNVAGIFAISASLVCGAIASNMEDKVMTHWNASQDELISMVYTFGALLMAVLGIATGEMTDGLARIREEPSSLLYIAIFSVLAAIGIQFVYLVMKVFGSLVTVMVTSVRKAVTVCLSFIVFRDKVFTLWHGVAMDAIAIGMSVNVYDKTIANKMEGREDDDRKLLESVQNSMDSGDMKTDPESPSPAE
jgi:adenosine 3'-phospho 5'-phosphosulfate transporter B3